MGSLWRCHLPGLLRPAHDNGEIFQFHLGIPDALSADRMAEHWRGLGAQENEAVCTDIFHAKQAAWVERNP